MPFFNIRAFSFVALAIPAAGSIAGAGEFEDRVRPILKEKCFGCHGPEKQKGKVRLDTLSTDLVGDAIAAETWHDALEVLHLGEMPPEDEEQLTKEERRALVGWLTAEVNRAAESQRLAGSGAVIRRLNRVEYQNTMRDLLGIDLDYARDLPPDPVSADGFQNNGAALGMSDLQLEYYLKIARKALGLAIVTGPKPEVFSSVAEQSETSRSRDGRGGAPSNRLGRGTSFVAKAKDFPDEGEFVVRVKARGEIPDGAAFPRLRIDLGYRADTQTPMEVVGVLDVTDGESRIYEFRGRMEDFPVQSRTQSKFPGMLVMATNVYDDGKPAPKAKTVTVTDAKGKKQKKKVIPEDPNFPKVVIESLEFVAPAIDAWPPEHHTRILFDPPGIAERGEESYAAEVLEKFMRRAFRRPVGEDEVKSFMRYFEKVRPGLGSFEEAMREVLAMVLVSPDFLYLIEPVEEGDGRRRLNDHELAARLSYFLWSSMPDERLFELAGEGKLADGDTLEREVVRMLGDPKSEALVEQFTDQWLDLGGIDRVAVNPEYYPDFDNGLKPEMRREAQEFFSEILRSDLSALAFLDSEFVVINEPLSRFYGISGPRGSAFEKVKLEPGDRRGGLLAQAGILLANSTGEDSHPIKRGVWIRERILDDPPAAPPANVPDLDDSDPNFAQLPLKEQLEIHLKDPACADCHEGIDPWGVALEDFDAVGMWRDEILRKVGKKAVKHPVDAAVTLPDGGEVDGLAAMKAHLLEKRKEDFAEALTTKLFTYGLGRSLELGDRDEVEELKANFIKGGYRLGGLIADIAWSEAFQTK